MSQIDSQIESNDRKCWESNRHDKVIWKELPLGAWLLSYFGFFNCFPALNYRLYILVLTFICYAAYHMSRKPFSVVANVLAPNCNTILDSGNNSDGHFHSSPGDYTEGWPPFNGTICKTLIGIVDYSWLFTYAVFMVISGLIADRVNLRYFLTVGMIGSGVFVGLLGVAYYADIHELAYFIIISLFIGIFESTGWPATVAIMGNWFGKKNRGLLMGIWNSHTSVGNILGTAVPSIWAKKGEPWAWSFFVPAFVMFAVGGLLFFFLILDPTHVGLPPPRHHFDESIEPNNEDDTNFTDDQTGSDLKYNNQKLLLSQQQQDQITDERMRLLRRNKQPKEVETKAVGLIGAFKIPGVIEYSFALFFAKLVAYTFLFWLPYYIAFNPIGGEYIGLQQADLLATLYDVGGIVGGISTGGLSDIINARAISCVIMMYFAVPTLFLYRFVGDISLASTIILILFCGLFINGPYALITTAVSNDLGTHKNLKDNQRAKATVGAIIDGMGSLGAAFGPLITGTVSDFLGWDSAFYILMVSCFLSSLMLTRLFIKELIYFYKKFKSRKSDHRRLDDKSAKYTASESNM